MKAGYRQLAILAAAFFAGCGEPAGRPATPERFVPIADRKQTSEEEVIASLVDDLSSDSPARSWPAEDYLKLYGKGVMPKVRPLLKSWKVESRASALRVLDAVGRDEVLPDLIALLMDEDVGIRYEAFLGLRKRTLQTFGYSHVADVETRKRTQKLWMDWLARYEKDVLTPSGDSGKPGPGEAAPEGTPAKPPESGKPEGASAR